MNYFNNPGLFLSNVGQNQVGVCLPGCKFTPKDANYCQSIDIVDIIDIVSIILDN